MTPESFYAHFETFAEAPNGIVKLRELILQLAVQGKLVPQDANDEPASVLAKQIVEYRKKTTGRSATMNLLTMNEIGFTLPSGWIAARFGDLMINRDGERVPVSRDIREGRKGPYDYYGASGVIDCIDDFLFDKPLLLIGEDGANLNNRSTPIAFIAQGKYWVNNHAHVLDGISLEFLRYIELYINATDLKPFVTGTAQPKMNQAKMNSIPIGLPPLAEQRRIVEKVDQLLALCDELAARQTARREARTTLVGATLDRLVSARSPAEFPKHTHRLRNNFDRLFDTPKTIPQLRQAILQLAVQGQLVPQDPNEDASDIVKMSESVQSLFDIPDKWKWVMVDQIADSRLGKMLDKEKNKGSLFAYLRNTNVHWFKFDLSSIKEMPFKDEELDTFEVRPGDVLICEGGHGIGRTAVWSGELEQVMFQKALHRVRPSLALDSNFFAYCMRVYNATGVLQTHYTGAGIPHLTGKSLAKIAFPLPPLAEQKRIVSKVTKLLSLCDSLEAKLTQAESASTQLLYASIAHILS